jgi:uncharacterized protein
MRATVSIAALIFPVAAFAFAVPPNDGYVTDMAAILSSDEEVFLEQVLTETRDATGNEVAVLVVRSLDGEPIADAAVEVGRAWGIGTKEKNNGILMLIAYEDREVFIATGYGLEGAVPDIVAAGIVEEDIAPMFREGKYAEGIRAGIEALRKHIDGEYTPERYASGGGRVPGFGEFTFFLLFVGCDFLAAIFGRSKSWWLGGVVGALIGLLLGVLYVWWWSIPVLVGIGLLFDFIVSKNHGRPRRCGAWMGGPRIGGGSGGFGGFGGGSFGGGGGGGRW